MTDGSTTPLAAKVNNLALTEYAAAPTPPSEKVDQLGSAPDWGIADSFLLPNGYPDVRLYLFVQLFDTRTIFVC